MSAAKNPERLVDRELLERISLEASETDCADLHRSVSYLVTATPELGELGHGAGALKALLVAAGLWVDEISRETDPKPPAEINPARLRELLLALHDNLAITGGMVDAMLGALPQDGAE